MHRRLHQPVVHDELAHIDICTVKTGDECVVLKSLTSNPHALFIADYPALSQEIKGTFTHKHPHLHK